MLINKLVNPLYKYLYRTFSLWQARQDKKRSEFALARLDDHLLDDIGLCRVDDAIIPTERTARQGRYRQARQRRKLQSRRLRLIRGRAP